MHGLASDAGRRPSSCVDSLAGFSHAPTLDRAKR